MRPRTYLIRNAGRDDIAAITAIYGAEVETGLATWEEAAPSAADMAERMGKIRNAGLPYLVAERDGQIMGYAYAGQFHTRSGYRYTIEDTVYIRPEAQRQGVGRALLEELLRRCEPLGYRQMMALIHWTPGSPSVTLHERLGFRLVGIAHGVAYKFGGWRDLAYMQRPLGGGSATKPAQLLSGS